MIDSQNKMNNSLQRMIVIPSEVFEKYKHIFHEDNFLSELDKKMRKILIDKNLNQIDKWHQYRENLLKFSFSKSKNDLQANIPASKIVTSSDKSSQTWRRAKYDKDCQTRIEKSRGIHKESQTINQSDDTIFLDEGEVFESYPTNPIDSDELDMEDEYRERALEGLDKNVKITREGLSTDPESYKLYELSNGEIVNVPTKRTTRSMVKNLRQSKLEFKKVKNNETRSKSRSKANNQISGLKWDPYK